MGTRFFYFSQRGGKFFGILPRVGAWLQSNLVPACAEGEVGDANDDDDEDCTCASPMEYLVEWFMERLADCTGVILI